MRKIVLITFLIINFNFIDAQDVTKIADSIMIKDTIPEMTFAVVTKDSVLIKSVLGHHKITEWTQKPNAKITDLFHLGSNTKAITGFIAATLVERNKINWNTKFFDLFPDLKNKSNSKYDNITLEDLLSHRAKVQPFTNGAEYQKLPKFIGSKQQRRTKFAEYILTLPRVENGASYNYSNAGYSIAAMMLEKVSGKSWEDLVIEILKGKLNIDFAFGWPNRNEENQPFGHWIENGKLASVSPNTDYNLSMAEPAGDLSMNIENYAKFIQLNIEGISGKDNFLRSEIYKFLHTAKDEYAIGWGNYLKDGQQISEHAGSDGTFFSYVQIDRKKNIGYIIIVNNGSKSAQKGVFKMLDILKKKYNKQLK